MSEPVETVNVVMKSLPTVDTLGILATMSDKVGQRPSTSDNLRLILTFVSGGLMGAILTQVVTAIRGRMQTMKCYYTDHSVISTLPTTTPQGDTFQNIYTKRFKLQNTTNTDLKEFKILFEFDPTAQITRHINTSKIGVDRYKSQLLKPNEYEITIKNFNRKQEVEFIFHIANVTDDHVNITETDCTGFEIKIYDKRKAALNGKLTVVSKDSLNKWATT